MMKATLIFDPQTAMSTAKVVLHHRYPAPPSVVEMRLRKGQGLFHLALLGQPPCALVTLHAAGMDLFIAQQRYHMQKLSRSTAHFERHASAELT
jgi:hypothetical protein